ncbi:hypothetical protein PENSPDRAFT_345836 [Peniophora sp. CONT]|nr:hypothetical protein PENSPDRAFT_345836 [Peniophora sp. CONT]
MPICPYPACNCGHSPLTASQYQEHVRTAPWAARFCPACKSVCGSASALLKHNKNVHGIGVALPNQPSTSAAVAPAASPRPAASAVPVYPPSVRPDRYCTLCRREFASPAALKQHYRDLKAHPNCAPCNEGFLNDAALTAHRSSVHGTRPTPTMTSVLSVSSSSSSSASSIFPKPQAPAASVVPQYKFACTLCNIPFARQDDLTEHYRKSLVHPVCNRCGIGARDAGTLADHVRLVHQTSTCAFCPGLRMFEDAVNAHRVEKGHAMCSSCNHDFSTREDLDTHIALAHPSYRCAQCNSSYSSATVLEQHYLDSPHHPRCNKCPDVGFPDSLSWEDHIRTNHPDLWCTRCNECFSTISALAHHYQASFEHPKCYDCGLGFFDEAARQEHMDEEESDIDSIASPSTEGTNFTAPPVIITLSPRQSPGTRSISLPPHVLQPSDEKQPEVADVNHDIEDAADIEDSADIEDPFHSTEGEAPSSEPDVVVNETVVVFHVQTDMMEGPFSRPKSADDARPSFTAQSISAPAIPTLSATINSPTFDDAEVIDETHGDDNRSADLRPADLPVEADRVSPPQATPQTSEAQLNMTGASLSIPLVDSPSVIHTDDSHSFDTQTETATPALSSRSVRRMKLEVLTSHSSGSPATVVISPSSLLDAPPVPRSGSALSAARSHASARPPSRLHEASRAASRSPYQQERLGVPDVQYEPTGFQGTFGVQRSRTPSVAYSSHQPPVRGPSPRGSRAPSPNMRHIPWTSAHETEYHAERQDDARRVSYIYCRLCRRDPARVPVATMCGHIYCHSCIVDEVVKSSKCPSCAAPTLLYSLIKLQVL